MVVGTVLRSHAGGYLVHSDEVGATLQCSARGRIKKERKSIVTGDKVELDEVDAATNTAVIATRKLRHNLLSRPLIANVDQAVFTQELRFTSVDDSQSPFSWVGISRAIIGWAAPSMS